MKFVKNNEMSYKSDIKGYGWTIHDAEFLNLRLYKDDFGKWELRMGKTPILKAKTINEIKSIFKDLNENEVAAFVGRWFAFYNAPIEMYYTAFNQKETPYEEKLAKLLQR